MKINNSSNKNNQFDEYIKIGTIGEYDISPTLRMRHSEYMDEFRTCLMAICKYTSNFKDKDCAKAMVWCYVYATIHEKYKNQPNEVLKLIKQLNETENAEFRDIVEVINNLKPVKHKCPECDKVINIPADFRNHYFHCLKCFEKLRKNGR